MPPKSQADVLAMIGDLRTEQAAMSARQEALRERVADSNLPKVLERLAVLESQQAESKKREEEGDRRRWQTQLLFLGSLLTLAIQITIVTLKK
jgi:hypothetical protein